AGYLASSILMAVPPFGIVGWAHPITAAGVLFPGWGWFGLAATAASLPVLASRWRPAVAAALMGSWLWSALSWTDPRVPDTWRGVDLALGASLGREAGLLRQRDLIAVVNRIAAGGVSRIVLPESALGFWTPTVARLWVSALHDTDI